MWILLPDHTKTVYQGNLGMDVNVCNYIQLDLDLPNDMDSRLSPFTGRNKIVGMER